MDAMRFFLAAAVAILSSALFPGLALAHGIAAAPPTDPLALVGMWSFDPTIQVPLVAAAVGYLSAVRAVNRAHPANPVPVRRVVAFVSGLVAVELALQSPIEHYDTTLFSVHMVQHILLTLVAAPLLAAGATITLLLRYAHPAFRRRWILPVLHSRALRAVTHPVVAWLVFAGVMWGSHFSPLFNASLEEPLVHELEHAAYLAAALLFWWPIVGADPSPWRLPPPLRALYAFLQMPQNTFLALAIYSAPDPLYAHYATLQRAWGPTVLADQQLAGGLMWVIGDLVFLAAILFCVVQWMRQEDRDTARLDARLDAERAEIVRREALLADRLARERAGRGS
jgi:putative copper resistance protein D